MKFLKTERTFVRNSCFFLSPKARNERCVCRTDTLEPQVSVAQALVDHALLWNGQDQGSHSASRQAGGRVCRACKEG